MKNRFVGKLSSWHTDRHTQPTDCSAWTTAVVGNNSDNDRSRYLCQKIL